MVESAHRVALVDAVGRLLRGPDAVPSPWPGQRDLRTAVDAADAMEIVPPWRDEDGVVTHLLQTPARTGEGAPWPAAERALVRRAAGEGEWPEWYSPGWREAVDAWISATLAAHGLDVAGPAEIVRWWSFSAVLRVPVVGVAGARDVWFKATCDGFRDEAAITAALADLGAAPIPSVLGVDPARAWLLLADVPGAGEDAPLATALAAATAMAQLQVRLVASAAALPIPVRDAPATVAALHTVVHSSVEAHLFPSELAAAARAAEPRLVAAVHALVAVGIPATLVHGDLHTGNLAGTPTHPVIFDWTDACLAHPCLDGRLLANSAASRRAEGQDAAEIERAVRDAFTAPWRAAYPDLDHDLAWELSRDAEDIFEMISYEGIVRAQAPGSRWELGGVITEKLSRLSRRTEVRPAF